MARVKSAQRTLSFLEIIAEHPSGLTFSEIQTLLDIPKSSAFNLIQEFIENDYLSYNEPHKIYYVGPKIIRLAASFLENSDLITELKLLADRLSLKLNTTIHAAILKDINVVYLVKSEQDSHLSLMMKAGTKLPAHCTAVGKMLLSQYDHNQLKQLYNNVPLTQLTPKSINTFEQLIIDLEQTATRGYAIEEQEASEYACCIALPITQHHRVVGAFSATFPTPHFKEIDIAATVALMNEEKKITERVLNILM